HHAGDRREHLHLQRPRPPGDRLRRAGRLVQRQQLRQHRPLPGRLDLPAEVHRREIRMIVNRNWGARLRHGALGGLSAVTLENELLRVTVLPGKGGDVVEFLHKPTDTDFVWLSPLGLRDPREHLHGAADDVAQFVDHYEGGWQEVFPNGGAPSEYRGARLAQHGEVAGLPWRYEVVTDTEREVAIRLHVRTRRLPYRLERTLRLRSGTAALEVEGRAVNESGLGLHAMWGHHLVYGTPFLR